MNKPGLLVVCLTCYIICICSIGILLLVIYFMAGNKIPETKTKLHNSKTNIVKRKFFPFQLKIQYKIFSENISVNGKIYSIGFDLKNYCCTLLRQFCTL